MAKSSKSAKSERQKLIDDAMKKQRGADKRRGYAIVGVCVLVAVVIVGAAAYRPIANEIELRQFRGMELASIGSGADVCEEVTTEEASGVSEHVPSGQEVTYEQSPPAFGPHWNEAGVAPAPFADKLYDVDDRPELESLVHNLEHGYTILWYDETAADDSEMMSEITAIATKFKSDDDDFRKKFVAAPWTSDDGDAFPDDTHVAFSHWKGTDAASTGVWQYCSAPSGEALETFMLDYPYTDSPEPNAF